MNNMRLFLLFLLICSVAFSIPIAILEQKETAAGGTYHFAKFTATYDCNKTVTIRVIEGEPEDDEGPVVEGAIVRLFYEERFTPILDSGVTDENGDYTYVLIGDPEKMANLFMFTVEKTDFRTKEGHFLLPLGACAELQESEETVEPEEPEEIEEEPEEIEEPVEPAVNETGENETAGITENETINDTGIYVPLENETEDAGETLGVCPFSLVLLLLLFLRSVS